MSQYNEVGRRKKRSSGRNVPKSRTIRNPDDGINGIRINPQRSSFSEFEDINSTRQRPRVPIARDPEVFIVPNVRPRPREPEQSTIPDAQPPSPVITHMIPSIPREDSSGRESISGHDIRPDSTLIENDNEGSLKIPRIIMQTWKTKDVPEKWRESGESIARYMPNWNRILMTDEDNREFVKKHFPDFLYVYDSYKHGIQRADAIRYMFLYIHGGIYMDLDYRMNSSIEHLFTTGDIYFMNSPTHTMYWNNSIMASRPRHPFWLEVIEKMKQVAFEPPFWAKGKHFKVMETTGPGMFSRVVQETKYPYSVLPVRLVSPRGICQPKGSVHGLLEPLEGCSWVEWDTTVYNWFVCNFSVFQIFMIIILVVILITALITWCIFRYKNNNYLNPEWQQTRGRQKMRESFM